MSCFISSGVAIGCSDSIGGVKKIYVGGQSGYTSGYTYDADSSVTGATDSGDVSYYAFEMKRGVSSYVQTTTKNYENGTVYFEQVLTAVLNKMDAEKRNQLKLLSQNDTLQVLVVDQNDNVYVMGQINYSYLSGGDANTGLSLADRNGMTLVFSAQEQEPSRLLAAPSGYTGNTPEALIAAVFSQSTIVG
jgi:hypothetical protein